jgi:hypothetical protein
VIQAGASLQEARRMSLYEWTLTTQAHQRNELRRDGRMLWLLNAWTEEEVTLRDLHGGTPSKNGSYGTTQQMESFKRRVMKEKEITEDLTIHQT